MFLTFGTAPAARSGVEKENSTPIEVRTPLECVKSYVCVLLQLPSYLPEELDPEKSKKVSCVCACMHAYMMCVHVLASS